MSVWTPPPRSKSIRALEALKEASGVGFIIGNETLQLDINGKYFMISVWTDKEGDQTTLVVKEVRS